jgi:hypothetical protein
MRRTRYAVDNWPSRVYLLGVLALTGWALSTVVTDPGPSFAGIWPVLATMPVSLLGPAAGSVLALVGAGPAVVRGALIAGVTLGALANAMAIGVLARWTRRRLAGRSA